MRKGYRFILLLMLAVPMLAQAQSGARTQRGKLEQSQSVFAASIRWGEFENAWQLVDPAYRAAHPLTDLELERYRQLQVSGYREVGSSQLDDGSVVRSIEIGAINRHTQVERTLRYNERWRWDPGGRRWWLQGGLPDFWGGD